MEAQTYALLMGLDLAPAEAPRSASNRTWHWSSPLLGLALAVANVVLVAVV